MIRTVIAGLVGAPAAAALIGLPLLTAAPAQADPDEFGRCQLGDVQCSMETWAAAPQFAIGSWSQLPQMVHEGWKDAGQLPGQAADAWSKAPQTAMDNWSNFGRPPAGETSTGGDDTGDTGDNPSGGDTGGGAP